MNEPIFTGLSTLAIGGPLALALCLALCPTNQTAQRLGGWAALPALVLAMSASLPAEVSIPWLFLGMRLGLDTAMQLFLLFIALLWLLAGIYARSYLAAHAERGRFMVYFLLAMAGNLGLVLAQDLLSFYLFFALMSFSAYGLVVHERHAEALRAGRIYMVMVVLGEVMLFAAMVMAAPASGSYGLDIIRVSLAGHANHGLIMLLALLGFGIKAGVLGLHVWLPLAHPVAPTPASAVLSGAMIKAGLIGWLKFLPLGEVSLPSWGSAVMMLGLVAAFYAVAVGMTQRNPKTLLAYSSVSQMGILTAAVGLGFLLPDHWPRLLLLIAFYAAHHGLAKGALFLGVGAITSASPAQRRYVFAGLLVPALALCGAPLSSGMFAKAALKSQITHTAEPWHAVLTLMLPLGSVATTLLMMRFLYLIRPGTTGGAPQLSRGIWLPWLVLLAMVLLLPWWPGLAGVQAFTAGLVFSSLWPLLLAAVLALFYLRTPWRPLSSWHVPAGDLLIAIEHLVDGMKTLQRQLASAAQAAKNIGYRYLISGKRQLALGDDRIRDVEIILARWPISITLMLSLCLIFLLWMIW